MFVNNLPVPADRIIPAQSAVPQFAVQYPGQTQWLAHVPLITQQCATIIANNAQKNQLRCFSYNLFSQNAWQNEAFINIVIFAIDYLSYISETSQMQADIATTITQVCEQVVKCISVMNFNDYPALQGMVAPQDLQSAQAAMGEFQQMRNLVQQHRNARGMQMQQPMQMGMPVQGMAGMPGMVPGAVAGVPGMMMGGAVQGGGDPRFATGGMAVMPGMQRMQVQQPVGGMRVGVQGGVMNPYGMTREDQREVAKSMITTQREMMGGGGRWNKATDETIDRAQGGNQIGMVSAFERRMSSAASAPESVAAVQTTPPTTDESNMNTTFQYPEGYFRNRELDSPEDRAMNMSNYRRAINIGALPKDALSPYDTPPRIEPVPVKTTAAPVAAEVTTRPTPREPAEKEADSAKSSSTEQADAAPQGAQATAGRWWETEDYQIPEAIPEQATPQGRAAEAHDVADVPFVEVGALQHEPEILAERERESADYTLEDEGGQFPWVPHVGQWYRPLYHPSRQERKLKIFRDGRHSEQVVIDRDPEDIPNMEYAQHVLNSPAGRRASAEADADRLLAAQKKIKEATDAYYANPSHTAEGGPSKIVLENPVTAFEANLITEVEGAESTVWTLNNLKRAMREAESGQAIDIFVTNALLYEAVYSTGEHDDEFLKAIQRLTSFKELYQHLDLSKKTTGKAVWELVNKRATIMLNQTLVLTMSLNEDVITSDFFADFPSIEDGISHTPDVVKNAWKGVQIRQLRTYFFSANEEDMQRNTDSLAYFLPDEKEQYLKATKYVGSLCTLTQLSVDAADLDIALAPHDVAQITETATPVLYKVAQAVFDSMTDLGDRKIMGHLLRTQDGVVYQLTFGALVEDALLISRRQNIWVDAR
jgi:hypothetical protein